MNLETNTKKDFANNKYYDKGGKQILVGDLLKVFHKEFIMMLKSLRKKTGKLKEVE